MNIDILLIAHLTGAAILAVLLACAVFVAYARYREYIRPLALGIGAGTFLQVLTGSLLALVQTGGGSLLAFCSKIGLYLALVILVEGLLFWSARREPAHELKGIFPIRRVSASLGASMGVAVLAAAMLIFR